jgi:hypothetical protein
VNARFRGRTVRHRAWEADGVAAYLPELPDGAGELVWTLTTPCGALSETVALGEGRFPL